jgi:DnaJ-class molecular chaperone
VSDLRRIREGAEVSWEPEEIITCPTCGGSGTKNGDECPQCFGAGIVSK